MPRKPEGVTRGLILDQAGQLFLSRGCVGTSVRDIAAACDVSVPALYHYFPSKDELVSAWCEPFVAASERVVGALDHAAANATDGAEFQTLALELYFDALAGHESVFRVVSTDRGLRSHPLAGHRLAELAARYLELLAGPGADDRLRAVAAVGAMRLLIRYGTRGGVDRSDLRAQAVASARAALAAIP